MVISEKIEEYSTERPHYTPGKALWKRYCDFEHNNGQKLRGLSKNCVK